MGEEKRKRRKPKDRTPMDEALERARRISKQARDQSLLVRAATAGYRTPVEYPTTPLGQNLRDMAAMIHMPGGETPHVLSTTLNGFDTHSRQKNAHDRQMRTLDGALGALMEDLGRSEVGKRTVVLAFSEFGRRVGENGSQGTDHGKGGPAFVLGHQIQSGIYGRVPEPAGFGQWGSDGHRRFPPRVYATLIEDLFDVDSAYPARWPSSKSSQS